jgi:hypothetical protein
MDYVHQFKKAPILMAHTRWATHGAKDDLDNAHPFRAGSVLLAHNGVISNHSVLNLKYDRKHVVDSQHILSHLIEGRDFKEIEAYGAITWLDESDPEFTVRIGKLSKAGDMHIARIEGGGVVWASTEEAVKQACKWADMTISHFYEVTEGKVYMATDGSLYVDEAHPSIEVSAPVSKWDWRWGQWDDDEMSGVWDRLARRSSDPTPTPPSTSVPMGWPMVDSLTSPQEGTEPLEDLEAQWMANAELEEAKLFVEEYGGVGPAAFDGLSPEEIFDIAFDLGWAGTDWGDEKAAM